MPHEQASSPDGGGPSSGSVTADLERQITDALLAFGAGDEQASDRLFTLSYPALRRIARRALWPKRPGATLNTTGLVHEAYLKLVDQSRVQYADRTHFFALMARAMRQIIVDHARRRLALKRGSGVADLELDDERAGSALDLDWVLGLDRAMTRLRDIDERMERLVEYRFFGGYTEQETAEILGLSLRSAQRLWQRARAWLQRDLGRTGP